MSGEDLTLIAYTADVGSEARHGVPDPAASHD
jgi:hypothetical protein